MSKLNATLSPKVNFLLILIWAVVAATFFFVIEPHTPIVLAVVGAALGTIGGAMQHLSISKQASGFVGASSMMDVRRVLSRTTWGKRYLYWLYLCKLVLAIAAFVLVRHPLLQVLYGYLAGYTTMMFVREIVTFRDTIFLKQLIQRGASNGQGAA